MAFNMPIPLPPRTPTPPSEEEHEVTGLGLEGVGSPSSAKILFDANALSPLSEHFPTRFGSKSSPVRTPATTLSPGSNASVFSPAFQDITATAVNDENNPFNFKTVSYTAGAPGSKAGIGQRRGHRYKHSSISHQLIPEPVSKAPLQLPASLPIPSSKEFWTSMSTEQALRAFWCLCHFLAAAFVQWSAHGSMTMTTLSHLMIVDFLGAICCTAVEVLGNFEVWKRSSIRHPFGLQRLEVLAGFGISVTLAFMGFDIISHNLKHMLEDVGDHEAHHGHHHDRITAGAVDFASLLAIVATLVSAFGLRNHERVGRVMRLAYIESLPGVLSNPAHLLTLSCAALLLILPLISIKIYSWLDRGIAAVMAISMCALGARLVKTLGYILLMSYQSQGVSDVLRTIETDPAVSTVEEAKFWRVHYGLCMATLKLRVRGTDESLARLRDRITSLVRNRLGGGYGANSQRWEVSTQLTLEKD